MNIKPYINTKIGRKIIGSIIEKIFYSIGVWASIWWLIQLIFPNVIKSYKTSILIFFVIATVIYVIWSYHGSKKIHIFALDKDGKEKVKKYMINWISQGNRVLISSRNLSWVDDN